MCLGERESSRCYSEKMTTAPLYEGKNKKKIYPRDFLIALRECGVKKGDIVLIHADISVFGKLCSLNKSFLLQSLVDVIMESVGEDGTVIMPTFSYSFCNGEIFDTDHTKSRIGILPEYFRKQPNVSRTKHPIFSAAIWGKLKNDFLAVGQDSFGRESIFGKIHQWGGKIVFLGAPFVSCTFLHYVEQAKRVPYRYMKEFSGKIRDDGREYTETCYYFVRDMTQNTALDAVKLEKHFIDSGIMKKTQLAHGTILAIDTDMFFKEGCKLLDKDINFFLMMRS